MTQESWFRLKICLLQDGLLAQNFKAVLVVIVKLAGDTIFAKICHDALEHILNSKTPTNIHVTVLVCAPGTWG